jgi:hypothetical protein
MTKVIDKAYIVAETTHRRKSRPPHIGVHKLKGFLGTMR